jgi:hypothetical protein
MKMPSNQVLALNGVAGCVVIVASIIFVRDIVSPPAIETCANRYHQAQSLTVRNGTTLLTLDDLQASFNGQDRGVLENLSLAALKDGPAPVAITVKFQAGSHFAPTSTNAKGGISFPWQPSGLPSSAQAACLSYHLYVPTEFDFAMGGVLPGLSARDTTSTSNTPDALDTSINWRSNGSLEMSVLRTAGGKTASDRIDGNRVQIEKGRWVRIDQELVLNTPTSPNGIVRTWVNKTLAVEANDLNMRNTENVVQAGMHAITHFGGHGIGGAAKKNETLYFTPFELRWSKQN